MRLPQEDLDAVVRAVPFGSLSKARVVITGASGFIGGWMVESLLAAGTGAEVILAVRDAARYRASEPHVEAAQRDAAHARAELIECDVRALPALQGVTHVIHAATPVAQSVGAEELRSIIVDGTRSALALNAPHFLLLSSGAVYGPSEQPFVEEQPCAPVTPYGRAKLEAEALCPEAAIARCFAFLGPRLPLDAHFAAGNFIRDALRGGPVRLGSTGRSVRTYLYASDLAVWLWTLLLGPVRGPVNVGGSAPVTIAELARTTARTLGGVEVVLGEGGAADRYVPSCARAHALGLRETVGLEDAILRTARFHESAR